MTSSPEQEQISAMFHALRSALSTIDPVERKAHYHMCVTSDGDLDEAIRTLAYKNPAEHLEYDYDDLGDFFHESYDLAVPFLADMWDLEQSDVKWPEDNSQRAACYFSSYNGEDFLVRIANWRQPSPESDEPIDMLAVWFEPAWSEAITMRMIYLGDDPIVSCKYNTLTSQQLTFADWSNTGELNPDDVMTAQKLVENIPYQEFDTAP